jgi:flagellar hook-associated protein 3 FlgL
MTVGPINIARVSQGLRTNFAIESLRRNQRDVFAAQTRIATGRDFVNPSDDPIRAARALDLTQALNQQRQFLANLTFGDNSLSAADSAISEISDLLIQASTIASQNVSNLTSAAERTAEAELIANIRQQLQIVGNRQINGKFIFGGRDTKDRPFIDAIGGIAYVGDTGYRFTRVEQDLASAVNIPGHQLFNALSRQIASNVDLTPRLTDSVRLDDIRVAGGGTIQTGILVFHEIDGAGAFTVDLTDADTIGDVIGLINQAAEDAGASLTATLEDDHLLITPAGSAITISDSGGGAIAASLGIRQTVPTSSPIQGQELIPRLTRLTPIEDLARGNGIDIDSGLIITNGLEQVTVDLAAATTVQDIINAINNAGVFVLAQISDDGTRIDVFNRVSGASLSIGENGGTTAADLGLRTMDTATPLSELNFGRGVTFQPGQDDIRITATDGTTLDVNLDGAETIGDVIELINNAATAGAVNITASFAATGNGIRITDGTGGAGALTVSGLNVSTAAIELGLDVTTAPGDTELAGRDVNQVRTEGILDALFDLERALRADDTRGITLAGGRLDELRQEVTRMHGVIGAGAQAMTSKRQQMEDAAITTELFLSEVRDLDYAEAITQLQSAMTQLQANLQTTSITMGLSLMDFLR